MTAQEILSGALARAGVVPGFLGVPSPPLLRRFYDQIMDDTCSRIGPLYQEWSVNITSGTAGYCLPGLDTVEAAYITNEDGDKLEIGFMHSKDARGMDAYTEASTGTPTVLILEGIGYGRLWPTPDYTTTSDPADGLILDGYGVYDPASYGLTTENPLKRQDQTCIELGVAWLILQHTGDARQANLDRQYRRARNTIEINASRYTPAHGMQRMGVLPAPLDNSVNPMGW
jgi:hypothetical protein